MKDIKKLIKAGKDAMKTNPLLRPAKDDIKAVINMNEGNALHFGLDLYCMGFALGFALGKRHERGDLPK